MNGDAPAPETMLMNVGISNKYIEEVIARCGGRRTFRIKQCWKNAQLLMTYDDEKRFRYCEGYLDGSIPHAWVEVDCRVVDVTEEALARKLQRMKMPRKIQRFYSCVYVADHLTLARHIARTSEHGPVAMYG
jgi:hypothetical protein